AGGAWRNSGGLIARVVGQRDRGRLVVLVRPVAAVGEEYEGGDGQEGPGGQASGGRPPPVWGRLGGLAPPARPDRHHFPFRFSRRNSTAASVVRAASSPPQPCPFPFTVSNSAFAPAAISLSCSRSEWIAGTRRSAVPWPIRNGGASLLTYSTGDARLYSS